MIKNLRSKKGTPINHTLTRREMQTLVMMTDGLGTKEIADVLDLSVKTVEKFRGGIIRKLGSPNLAVLTKKALKLNLIKL